MNVPKLRFPEFSGEWEEKKLADIALFSKGKGYTKNDLQKNGTPIILYGRMYTKYETIIDNVDTFVNMQNGSVISKGGEIIVPASGETAEEISRASVVKNKGIILGGDLNIISIPTDKFSSSFLALNISNGDSQRKLSKLAQGKSVVHLHNEDLSNLEIKIPSLPEQQKIADFLSTVDSIIASETKILNALQKKKKALMQKLFSQQFRFKADDGSEFPEWVEKKLGEVCDVRDGTHDSPKYQSKGYPFITTKNLVGGRIDYSTASLISKDDYEQFDKRSHVDDGDILMPMIGTIGGAVIVKKECDFAIKNVALIKNNENIVLTFFLYQFLFSNNIVYQFHLEKKGGTQQFIALDTIRKLKIVVPTKEEQRKIADCLSSLDNLIQNQQKIVTNWQQRKKGLLQQIFV